MLEGFDLWANPSSPHAAGRKARSALEDARARIAAVLGWQGEVLFTSGASEAAALALGHAKGGARLVSAVEHEAVLRAAPEAERLPVRADGSLEIDGLDGTLDRERPLVACQQINSETGNAFDLDALSARIHAAGGWLLVDVSQSAGKLPLPGGADMAIVSAHKFGGPIGIGVLLVRDLAMLEPAGGQERGYRRGTENLPGAMGMAAALEACASPYVSDDIATALDRLAHTVRGAGGLWLSDTLAHPTGLIHGVAMPGMSGSAQLMRFDMAGIAVSQGSACSSGSLKRSPVLAAMGLTDDVIDRTIRVSVGWTTTADEVDRFAKVWQELAASA